MFSGSQTFSVMLKDFTSVQVCLGIFRDDQRFSVMMVSVSTHKIAKFLLCNNNDHGCFRSQTAISIETAAVISSEIF